MPSSVSILRRTTLGLFVMVVAWLPGRAEVVGIDVSERGPVLQGRTFGAVGAYERIAGKVRFAVDPASSANAAIRDLALAATNAAGKVEFSATFFALRPRDPARGNRTILLEISNRGGKSLLNRFCLASADDNPHLPAHFGDGWLLEEGYTLLWVGWQWDVPEARPLRLFPAPLRDSQAAGLVRSEYIPDADTGEMPLGDRGHNPVPLAEPLSLSRRSTPEETPVVLPPGSWEVSADGRNVRLQGGFKSGLLYEFVYRGRDGVIAGLSLAAVRDLVSHAKHAADSPLGGARQALAFGISQSGRFLRHFLYEGFNADEAGRRVFEGIWADVAGAGRGSFNHRYAQASRDGNPWTNVFYPTDVFPFHDLGTTDAATGRRGGLLERAVADRVAPRIFYTNSSYEYWGRAAALIHTDPAGTTDLPLAAGTRIYTVAGAQHGPGVVPPVTRNSARPILPTDHRPLQRALLSALQRWVAEDVAPPDSVYPRIGDKTLIPVAETAPPAGPLPAAPRFPRLARRLELGPEFERTGVVTAESIVSAGAYPLRVPALDGDGIDRAGIRLPLVAVPLGSHLPWNHRTDGGAVHMANFVGSFVPFAADESARRAAGDSRPSRAARYQDRADYLGKVAASTDDLIARRLLLPRDRAAVIEQAAKLWDHVAPARP